MRRETVTPKPKAMTEQKNKILILKKSSVKISSVLTFLVLAWIAYRVVQYAIESGLYLNDRIYVLGVPIAVLGYLLYVFIQALLYVLIELLRGLIKKNT